MEKVKWYVIIFFISLLSTVISGYQYNVSDQEIFIPYILKFQDPTLFKGDILFSQFTANASLFYQIMAIITKYVNMEVAFFIGFLIVKSVLFIGIFKIGEAIFKKKEMALVSLLPFLIPKFIGGTATYTYDNFFGYRSIGVVLYTFYLLFLIRNQFNKATLISGICLFFHPLSIIPSILLAPVLILKNSENKIKDLVVFTVSIALFGFLYQLIFRADSNLFEHSVNWMQIIKERDDYIFPSLWGLLGWLSLIMYMALTFFNIKFFKRNLNSTFKMILITSLALFLLNYLVLEVFQFPGFAKFQLARSIAPIATIGLILSPCFLLFKDKASKFFGFLTFIALCLNLYYLLLFSFTALSIILLTMQNKFTNSDIKLKKILIPVLLITFALNFFQLKNKINFPLERTDWIKTQIWADQNTSKDTVFLLSFQSTGFRTYSKRPIVGDVKDGAVVIYSKDFANRWSSLQKDLKGFNSFKEEDFISLKNQYYYNLIVVKKDKKLNFEKVYENNTYTVYKLPIT